MIIAAHDEASRGARDGHYVERERLKIRRTWLPLIAGLLAAGLAQAQTDVLVSHYDDANILGFDGLFARAEFTF